MSCNMQTTQPVTFLVPKIRRGQSGLIARLRAWPGRLWQMAERQRQRQRLLELDDHMLEDIGLTRAAAEEMGRRPFWR